jgi:putative PIN family toxin of toxin-antitoxin system
VPDVVVVLDTNVLISAVVFGGIPRAVLSQAITGKIGLAVSPAILDEVQAVLTGGKCNYPLAAAQTIRQELESIAPLVYPDKQVRVVHDDPADNRILECALAAQADCIVTGDHHLLDLRKFNGIPIKNPSSFIQSLKE